MRPADGAGAQKPVGRHNCLIGTLFALGAAQDGEFERARAAFLFWPVYGALYALLGLKTLCGDVVGLLSELFFEN